MRGAVTVNSGDGYTAAALAGLGIIQVPRLGVRRALADGTLVEILPDCLAEPMPVTLLYPQRRYLSRRVKALTEWIEHTLESSGVFSVAELAWRPTEGAIPS